MQYSKCQRCVYNGHTCKMIMAQVMSVLSGLSHLIEYSQTRKTNARCKPKLNCCCENFTPRKEEKENV